MSLNKKLDEVAHYIKTQYPKLNFENVSVSDSCVTNICNIIFKRENDRSLKKTIANAINRNTSSLRKRIESIDNSDLCNVSEMNCSIIKCIEDNNYTSSDFLNYNHIILNDICKQIKYTADQANRNKVYSKCKKYFNGSLCNQSDDTNNISSNTVYFNENSGIENCISYSDHTEPELVQNDYVSLEYNSLSPQSDYNWMVRDPLIPSSTPILPDVESDLVTPSKLECRKNVGLVPSPLKNAYFKKTPVKSGVVLPLETKNCFPKQYDGDECEFFEGIFTFSCEEWSHMLYTHVNGKKLLEKTKYPIMFRKRIRTVNNTCVVNAKRVRYFKNHCNVYMYCSHKGCKTFRIHVQPENRKFVAKVFSSGLNYHHNPDDNGLTNHVKGFQRDLNKEALKKTKAFSFRSDAVDIASPTQLKCGNLQGIKSDDVIRKIRSEALRADDYDRDDFHDIVLMCNDKENNFVKHVGIPSVHCYSNEQLDILKNLIKKQKPVTGYLDATGTVVRKIDKNSKRVLYYVLVVNVPLPRNSSVTCPVVEMISSAHDIVAISQWLNAFKAFVLKHKLTWPVFTNIVTDFSYAQMNAFCIGWNGFTSIFDYLNWCYRVLVENHDESNVTIINICANHYTKIIVNHVYTYFQSEKNHHKTVEKTKRNDVIDWICILFNTTSLTDVEQWFKVFSVILLSPYGTGDTKNAISTMRTKCNDKYQLPNESNNEGKDHSEEINKFLCESNTSNSMMFCRFQSIKEQVKSEVLNCAVNSENIILNEYYDESYLQEFIVKCVPFLALWTPIMNNKVNNGIETRQSNATVESWFKTVKQDLLEGDRRFKCGRFLKLMRQRVMNVHKQIKYNIRKGNCTRALDFDSKSKQSTPKGNRKRKISELSSLNHLDAIESWGKKEKQHKHLQHTKYRPFKALSLKIPKSSTTTADDNNISPKVVDDIESVKVTECDNETRFTVDETINNDVGVHDLSKPFDNNCLMKSVSTPGSHKSPFRQSVQSIDLHKNMLPKDLTYYKRMPENRDYIVGSYSYILPNTRNCDILADLYFQDFDTLSGEKWLCNFVIDICLVK